MTPLYVINDLHIGAIRAGGTTPATSAKLRQETLAGFRGLLTRCEDGDLLINGDLFDTMNIPYSDLWAAVELCSFWLGKNPHNEMYAARGNHDVPRNTSFMSSFDLFCKIMETMHPDRFYSVTEPKHLKTHNAYVIPHMPNQDLFNEALKAVPKCKRLFVHANYDNNFAVESDHSLNVSPAQAEAVPVEQIIFGHEHQRKTALAGKVVVVGNQIPTSVADCLGNDAKYLLKITDKLEHIPCWTAEGDFARPDWRDFSTVGNARFVRVEGKAEKSEAAEAVSAISKLRSTSQALVITNAVEVEGVALESEILMTLTSLKAFDILGALLEIVGDEDGQIVKQLMEKHNVQTSQTE